MQDLSKSTTPSRLQNASSVAEPRASLHSLRGTLAGQLLASLPQQLQPGVDCQPASEGVRGLDSTAAATFTVPASEVLPLVMNSSLSLLEDQLKYSSTPTRHWELPQSVISINKGFDQHRCPRVLGARATC